PMDWTIVAYYGVLVTVVAFLLWARGVARVPASVASVFTGVLPVSALAFSHFALGEIITAWHLLAAALVAAGIVVLARAREACFCSSSPGSVALAWPRGPRARRRGCRHPVVFGVRRAARRSARGVAGRRDIAPLQAPAGLRTGVAGRGSRGRRGASARGW